jgi:hypothetical protein
MYAPNSQYLPSVDAFKRFVTAGTTVGMKSRGTVGVDPTPHFKIAIN